jgi:hypothetical protein
MKLIIPSFFSNLHLPHHRFFWIPILDIVDVFNIEYLNRFDLNIKNYYKGHEFFLNKYE